MASPDYSDAEKRDLSERLERFRPFLLTERVEASLAEDERLADESLTATSNHYNGHQVVDYAHLMESGVSGLMREMRHSLETARDPESIVFLHSLLIAWEGVSTYIRRHADEARSRLSEPGLSAAERARLGRIERNCLAVSLDPPASFEEAIVLFWFFLGFADYDSIGRFDRYLRPFYWKSREAGMSRKEAVALLEQLWRAMDRNGAILNMTIGGRDADGNREFDDLSLLVLEVTRDLGLKGPNLCLRVDPSMPDGIWEEVHRSLSAGQALPALYNEEMIVPMLLREGISPADAWNFCLAGCSQVVVPGCSSFACDIGTYSPLKCLELALHEGFDRRTGKRAGPATPKVSAMTAFEDVMAAYRTQTGHAIRMGVSVNDKDHGLRTDVASCIRSALTADCITRGRGIFQGGARYYAVQNEVVGLTNTANALMAIRQVVFEERRMTLGRLVAILDADFEGEEPFRRYLANKTPKFGTGHDGVDGLRASITRDFFRELASHPAPLGGRHWPGEVIFHYHVQYGKAALASADGRKAGTPLADSSGPSQGTDAEGVAGILQSLRHLEYCGPDYPNTCSCLNLKFDRRMWASSKDRMVAMLRTFMKTVFQLQVNVLSARDLEEALIHPEAYRSLVVRVGGYSAYFVGLHPDIQKDILARTTLSGY
jgi:formate C-acetyltransferase